MALPDRLRNIITGEPVVTGALTTATTATTSPFVSEVERIARLEAWGRLQAQLNMQQQGWAEAARLAAQQQPPEQRFAAPEDPGFLWDDKLYNPGGKGKVERAPRHVEGTRLIRVSDSHYPFADIRNINGARIEMAWGQPDEDGVYSPSFTVIDDGFVAVDAQILADALPAALYKQEDTYIKATQNGQLSQWWRDVAVRTLDNVRKRLRVP